MVKMQLVVNGDELWLPRDMVGKVAAVAACERLQINDPDLRLRRMSDQSFVGDTVMIGDVLADGDRLELASPFS